MVDAFGVGSFCSSFTFNLKVFHFVTLKKPPKKKKKRNRNRKGFATSSQ